MMGVEESDIEIIDRYIRNTLSADELRSFNQRIGEDIEFAEKVRDYQDIIAGVKGLGHGDFRKEVASWEAEVTAEEVLSKGPLLMAGRWKIFLSMAASVLLLIAFALYFVLPSDPKDHGQLFNQYFTPYEDVITVRDGLTETQKLEEAMAAYNQKRYREAAALFDEYLGAFPEDVNALFYRGISSLALHDYKESIATLTKAGTINTTYLDQSEWYIALAHLGTGEIDSSKKILMAIAKDEGHDYNVKAEKLLKELE